MINDHSNEQIEKWLQQVDAKHDHALLTHAYALAKKYLHDDDPKKLLNQGVDTATLLLRLHCDSSTLAAAIIYPTLMQTKLSIDNVKQFDQEVAKLISGAKRMETIDVMSLRQSEFAQERNLAGNLRKMLLAVVDDIRVVLIKLAERLITLKYLRNRSERLQQQVAQKVMNLYAPLANRLGIGQFKWEMEDWAFRYLNPEQYQKIYKATNKRKTARDKYINRFTHDLKKILSEAGIKNYEVSGRAKHIYSIYRKIQRKNIDFSEIYDASAVRVLLPNIEDCYTALSAAHAAWEHITKEFDDYIAKPKPNGYQSIHTAVIGPDNCNVEIQIRTQQMHEESELGVAAHWKYKEGKKGASRFEEKINWLRDMMDWQKEVSEDTSSRNTLYQQLFEDRVYVFTPNGDVIDLPVGATPLDFAYRIHTEIGHRCRGAKVNDKMVTLTYALQTGDRVDIVTTKTGQPSRDWLNHSLGYLVTHHAKAKVRHWFHKEQFEEHTQLGTEMWEKTYRKSGFSKTDLSKVYKQFNFNTEQDLLAAIGAGDIGVNTVLNRLRALAPEQNKTIEEKLPIAKPSKVSQQTTGSYVSIEGIGNLLTQLARCCQPIPGDPIVGYITKGHGISIHHQDCHNIQQAITYRSERVIDVNWGDAALSNYPVDLIVECDDRPGLLRDISNLLADEKTTILGLNTHIDKLKNVSLIYLTIEIESLDLLDKIIKRLQHVPEVIRVKRRQ